MIDVGCQKLFACDECPIVAELDYRLANSEKHGYPFQFDHCACDKVEDEFFSCGYCEDAWVDVPKRKRKGKRKTGRAYRRKMRVQKFNRKKNFYRLWWFGTDDVQYTYIKRPKSSGRKKFYKDYSNRIVRRSDVLLPNGNQYRKLFDLWWTVW